MDNNIVIECFSQMSRNAQIFSKLVLQMLAINIYASPLYMFQYAMKQQ